MSFVRIKRHQLYDAIIRMSLLIKTNNQRCRKVIRPFSKTNFQKQRFNIGNHHLMQDIKNEYNRGIQHSPIMLQTSCRKKLKKPISVKRYTSELVVKAASFKQSIILQEEAVQTAKKQEQTNNLEQGQKKELSQAQAQEQSQTQEQGQDETCAIIETLEQKVELDKLVSNTIRQSFEPDIADYNADIHRSWLESEQKSIVPSTFMDNAVHVNARMRSILVDWLWDVSVRFKLLPETMGLTIQLIDRYLYFENGIKRKYFQLLGVTCMLLASKYEEIFFPEVNDLVYITDGAYRRNQILSMEITVLNTLGFEFSLPTTVRFILFYCQYAAPDCWKIASNAYSVFKIISINHFFSSVAPSEIAFAAVALGIVWKDFKVQTKYAQQMFKPSKGQHLKAVSGRAAAGLLHIQKADLVNNQLTRLEQLTGMKRDCNPMLQKVWKHVVAYLTGETYSNLSSTKRDIERAYRHREALIQLLLEQGIK